MHSRLIKLQKGTLCGLYPAIRARVVAARISRNGKANSALTAKEVKHLCVLSEQSHQLLEQALTISDLAQSKHIDIKHLSEAISYRKLDRST